MRTAVERQRVVRRARELASSGRHRSWVSIEGEMRSADQIPRRNSPLDDCFLRGELDFLCAAARRGRPVD